MKNILRYAFFFFFCILAGFMGGTARAQDSYHFDPAKESPAASSAPERGSSYRHNPADTYGNAYPVQPRLSDPYTKYSIEINGNASAFEGRFGIRWPVLPDSVYFGVNGLTRDEDFYAMSLDLTYGSRVLDEKLNLDIGLKSIWGEAENGNRDATMGAVALMVKAEYDLPDIEISYSRYLDMEIFGELSMSPSPLTFADGEKTMESRFGININLSANKRSAVILGYRYVKMEFEDRGSWDKIDDSAYLGFRIRF